MKGWKKNSEAGITTSIMKRILFRAETAGPSSRTRGDISDTLATAAVVAGKPLARRLGRAPSKSQVRII